MELFCPLGIFVIFRGQAEQGYASQQILNFADKLESNYLLCIIVYCEKIPVISTPIQGLTMTNVLISNPQTLHADNTLPAGLVRYKTHLKVENSYCNIAKSLTGIGICYIPLNQIFNWTYINTHTYIFTQADICKSTYLHTLNTGAFEIRSDPCSTHILGISGHRPGYFREASISSIMKVSWTQHCVFHMF